jgi:cobalt-zinc-cadmium efflux system protein
MSGDHAIATGAENEKRLKWALALTGGFLIVEVIGGLWTGSLALLSDAAHMLTDVVALIIALLAIRIGKRAADDRRTYGYKRFEILAAAFNAVVLFLVAFYILYEAYQRFQNPPDIEAGWMMGVAAVGLAINIISMRMLAASSEHSLNVKGAYLEVLSDMVGSIGVIVAALIIQYTGWWQVDPILAVLIGFWILPRTWKLLSESLNILLEGVPMGVDMKKLQADLAAIPGVVEVHDLHVWAITSGQNSLTAHLLLTTDAAGVALMEQAQTVVKAHGIDHSNFQVEMTAHDQLTH